MGNSIEIISGANYSPYKGVQRAEQVQLQENTKQSDNEGKKTPESGECETCDNRSYKDQSNDSSVSFQSSTRIAPEMAASAVRAHEQEHVTNNSLAAEKKDMKAYSTVAIHTDVCPECNRIYVSGGTTKTTYVSDYSPQETSSEQTKGKNVDIVA